MAFFRIAKNLLADPPTFAAMQESFSIAEEFKPMAGGEHPYYKWYKCKGPGGIPDDDAVEIELHFEAVSPTRVNLKWRIKNEL